MRQIITSLADTDLYKPTMAQAAYHRFPATMARFDFKCRSKVDLRPYCDEIRSEIDAVGDLHFTDSELGYMAGLRYIQPDFVEFLRILRLNPKHVTVQRGEENLEIVAEGPWHFVIWWEIYILAIVAEVWHRHNSCGANFLEGEALLREKCALIRNTTGGKKAFRLIEFGTRRRFSREWQRRVLEILKDEIPDQLFGTSNVLLAQEFNLRPIGTMAHEFLQAAQGMRVQVEDSQKFALEAWVQEYRGDLGIALSDIFGIDAFLADFDLYFAKLFDGVRHDSGDPYTWTDKILAHYERLGIQAATKAAVYSDGLDVQKALALWVKYEGLLMTSYGIGTNLTCDIPGVTALQIVMKMTECNGNPVAKVSDSSGKGMCRDLEYGSYLQSRISVKVAKAIAEGRI